MIVLHGQYQRSCIFEKNTSNFKRCSVHAFPINCKKTIAAKIASLIRSFLEDFFFSKPNRKKPGQGVASILNKKNTFSYAA